MLAAVSQHVLKLYLFSLLSLNCVSDHHDDTVGYAGMVSSTNYIASQAGQKILQRGGTAADAAVAVQMALNVVQPSSAGIGGGAFIMYYDAEKGEMRAIDGREEAPNAFNPYVFCKNITCYNSNGVEGDCSDCNVIPWPERKIGGLGIGVPGTLYSFKRLWEIYGAGPDIIPWSDLFTDAIDLAQNGFTMYQNILNYINFNIDYLSRFNSSCKLLLNYPICNESRYAVGDIVTFPDLANTFTILSSMTADEAIDEFYKGDIATAIVDTVQSAMNNKTGRNGLMTKDDLAGYRAVFREPISTTIQFDKNGKKYDIYGMNMPSSGPLTVQYQLKMLEYLQTDNAFDSYDINSFKNDPYSAQTVHYLFSAGNIAFADRNQYMADNDFVNVPIDGMQDEDYLKQRAEDYLSETAQDVPIEYGYPDGFNDTLQQSSVTEGGTSHICIVDQYGNVASITTTIEGIFGSNVVVDGYGFFLNNELTDFSAQGIINGDVVANGPEGGKKQRINAMDLLGYNDTKTSGGKRPRSSMSPTIILSDGTPIMAVGARGGSTIIGAVTNVIIRRLMYNMGIQEAVNAARVWAMNSKDGTMMFEKSLWEQSNSNLTAQLVDGLEYNAAKFIDRTFGSCNAIIIGDDNMLYCGADKTRWDMEGCAAVCNSSHSLCPFAMTTVYPKSTEIETTDVGLDDVCINDDDYDWLIRIKFNILFLLDPKTEDNRISIRRSCKQAFFRTIFEILMDWMDDFCFDLKDSELVITESMSNSRRLLQTEYSIDAGYEYNNNLQEIFFAKPTLFGDGEEFGSIFSEELIDVLIDSNMIDSKLNASSISITVALPVEDKEEEKDHSVEGSLINAVVILGLVDALIFCACLIYIIKNTKPRADEEGDINWKDARKNHKIPYWVPALEILDSIIHWILAIMIIVIPSYLGWILFCLLLGAEIILYIRYILYKQLILYQIPKLRKEIKLDSQLNDEIISRRIDIGIFGIILASVEDIPVIIIAIIVGENFGYNGIEIISLLIAVISLCIKIILLIFAKFGSTEQQEQEKNENQTEKAIELAEEKEEEEDEEKQKLTPTPKVEEEQQPKVESPGKDDDDKKDADDDKKDDNDKKNDADDANADGGDDGGDTQKNEEEQPLNKETETGTKDDGDGGDGDDGGDKPKEEEVNKKDYVD